MVISLHLATLLPLISKRQNSKKSINSYVETFYVSACDDVVAYADGVATHIDVVHDAAYVADELLLFYEDHSEEQGFFQHVALFF